MRRLLKKYGLYLFVTALIMLPLLAPGYILTLDLVFTPEIRMPERLANDYVWYAFLHVLDLVLPSELIEKVILISIPLLAAIGMHRLLENLLQPGAPGKNLSVPGADSWQWAIYAAGIFYAINPFTYSHFMAGQYLVLLGYALMPFFVRALLAFLASPGRRTLLTTVGITLLVSIISLHTLGIIGLIAILLLGLTAWQQRKQPALLKLYALWGVAGLAIFVILSSYWLVPFWLGQGDTASLIRQFDHTHTEAFATTGSNVAERILNVLRLQGFWLEGRGQYIMPQDQLPGWGTVRLAIWGLAGWGLVVCWRQARPLAVMLITLGVTAVVLAAGVPEGVLTGLGYREPHKFTGIIALVFGVSIAIGTGQLLSRIRKRSEMRYTLAASGMLLIIVLFTLPMYRGFGGQLKPRDYPEDWYTLNTRLSEEQGEFQTVFVPWHQYMSFAFTGRIIAHPAEQFFDTPALTSNDPEIGAIQPGPDNIRQEITRLLSREGNDPDFGARLAAHDIKYLVLTKDFDYRKYGYLDRQDNLKPVWDTPTLRLYRNTAWRDQ